jgi:hypothetical protein
MASSRPPLQHSGALRGARAQAILRFRAPFGQVDERFFGPQVPGENPVHWIAERAPPTFS